MTDRRVTEHVAAELRAELARQGRTQVPLILLWGVSNAGVSRRLLGHTPIDVDELSAICEWLGKSPMDFLPLAVLA